MKRIITGFFCCLLAWTSAFSAENTLLPPGEKAPSFSLSVLGGKRVALYELCGDVLAKPYLNKIPYTVVLSFWATYCVPCQKEMPQLEQFARKHLNDSVKVLCVNIDAEGVPLVEPFVAEKKYTNTILIDQYKKTAERFGVKSLPALFVIDRHGVIKYSALGYDEKINLNEKLERIVADVKANKSVAPSVNSAEAEVTLVKADSARADTAGKKMEVIDASFVENKSGCVADASKNIAPRQKWRAVARVELGEAAEKVAAELGVSVAEIAVWSEQLKKAALTVWGARPDSSAAKVPVEKVAPPK